ncbi:MAG: HipA domain-containing protein [Parvibaculum sp.]
MSPSEILDVRLEGHEMPVGQLVRDDSACLFAYSAAYVRQPDAIPISLSLPFSQDIFDDPSTRAFFDNLLPENNQLQQVMDRERIARDDIVGLLKHLGGDCPGAISCVPRDAPPVKIPGNVETDYVEIAPENLADIMRRLADRLPLPEEIQDPSPVAGVQRKIAVTEIAPNRFGHPKDKLRVPTTHILKVPERGREREVQQEAIAARLAALVVNHPVALPAEFKRGDEVGLLIKRFDRNVSADGLITRIHQEDFCQALGLPASLKYERKGTAERHFSAAKVHDLLGRTNAPGLNRLIFLRASIFNLAIGNTDSHAKNHALIYDQGGTPRLAPLYDMLPIRLSNRYTHELAFKIGEAENFDEIKPADLMEFIHSFGPKTEGATRRFLQNEIGPMILTLDQTAHELTSMGHKDFDDLIGREIEKITNLLGLNLEIRERDYFGTAAGGWGMPS